MRHLRTILLATGALAALLAAVAFSRSGELLSQQAEPKTTPSEVSVPSVSPDALPSEPPSSSASGMSLSAKAAAVKDLATGSLLYGFRPDTRWPIASVTKIMTAQIILDRMDLQAVITLAPEDFSGGSSVLSANLQPGGRYQVTDLLKILLLPSSNEAAEAFARAYGRADFITAMNAKAAEWGLAHTHFDDPSGISVANQSTPREFLELVRRAYAAHPEIFAMTRARSVLVRELSTGAFQEFLTTNNFAGRAGFIGGKTGTTPEAGDNLVSIFEVNGAPVAVAVFGAADRYAATESLLQLIR